MTGDEEGHGAAPLSVPHCFVHVLCCRGFSYMYILLLLNKPNLKKPWNLCPQIGLSSKGWVIGWGRDLSGETLINEECWCQCDLLLTSGGVESMSLMQFLVWAAAHFLSAFDLPLVNVSNIFEGICGPVQAVPFLCTSPSSTHSFLTLPLVCSTRMTIMQTSAKETPTYRVVLEGCGA